ncbi:unnamed protein product [Heterobilharzia americana]|nr:unnamed protein product [Heterobilharzia americana]
MGNCLRCRNIESSSDVRNNDAQRRSESEARRNRLPPYYENDPIMHPTPGVSRPMSQLTEEEQVRIATRMGLISTLPLFKFDESKREKLSECIICMCEYEEGEELRYLPCLHTYHRICIDDWLMRALTCPSCLEEIRPNSPAKVHSNNDSQTVTVNGSSEMTTCTPTIEASIPTSCSQQRQDSRPINENIRSNSSSHSQTMHRLILGKLKSHNNSSGGDISDILNTSPTSVHPLPSNPQPHYHRRTRSIGSSRRSHSVHTPSANLLDTYRRGNSVTAIDMIYPVQSSEDNLLSSVLPTNQSDFPSPINTLTHPTVLRQLNGDSNETQPH